MRETMPLPQGLKVGLRFRRSQVSILRNLADRCRSKELGEQAVAVFEQAAEAAHTGEPLIVVCSDVEEAKQMAAGYVLYGVQEPVVEQVAQ